MTPESMRFEPNREAPARIREPDPAAQAPLDYDGRSSRSHVDDTTTPLTWCFPGLRGIHRCGCQADCVWRPHGLRSRPVDRAPGRENRGGRRTPGRRRGADSCCALPCDRHDRHRDPFLPAAPRRVEWQVPDGWRRRLCRGSREPGAGIGERGLCHRRNGYRTQRFGDRRELGDEQRRAAGELRLSRRASHCGNGQGDRAALLRHARDAGVTSWAARTAAVRP